MRPAPRRWTLRRRARSSRQSMPNRVCVCSYPFSSSQLSLANLAGSARVAQIASRDLATSLPSPPPQASPGSAQVEETRRLLEEKVAALAASRSAATVLELGRALARVLDLASAQHVAELP